MTSKEERSGRKVREMGHTVGKEETSERASAVCGDFWKE